jgi:hypothetical protein
MHVKTDNRRSARGNPGLSLFEIKKFLFNNQMFKTAMP